MRYTIPWDALNDAKRWHPVLGHPRLYMVIKNGSFAGDGDKVDILLPTGCSQYLQCGNLKRCRLKVLAGRLRPTTSVVHSVPFPVIVETPLFECSVHRTTISLLDDRVITGMPQLLSSECAFYGGPEVISSRDYDHYAHEFRSEIAEPASSQVVELDDEDTTEPEQHATANSAAAGDFSRSVHRNKLFFSRWFVYHLVQLYIESLDYEQATRQLHAALKAQKHVLSCMLVHVRACVRA